MSKDSTLASFIRDYTAGKPLQAFQDILSRSYEELEKEGSSPFMLSWVDAMCFSSHLNACVATRHLLSQKDLDPSFTKKLEHDLFRLRVHLQLAGYTIDTAPNSPISNIKSLIAYHARAEVDGLMDEDASFLDEQIGHKLFACFHALKENRFLSDQEIDLAIESRPEEEQPLYRAQILAAQNWNALQDTKPELVSHLIEMVPDFSLPYIPIPAPSISKGPALYVFSDLFEMVRHLDPSLLDPKSVLLIQNLHPKAQLEAQGSFEGLPIVGTDDEDLIKHQQWDDLYYVGKMRARQKRAERLGKKRYLALHQAEEELAWYDPHKTPPSEGIQNRVSKVDLLSPVLDSLNPTYPVRAPSSPRLRLAHIVPQVVRGGHAPTRLLKMLIGGHDRSKFDLAVLSTERLLFRPSEYPYSYFVSTHSAERGGEILKDFENSGVQVFVEDGSLGYIDTAKRLVDSLNTLKVDIAVFHGPDVINVAASRMTDVPFKVCFEHGTLPSTPGFDLVISSQEESVELHGERLKQMGSKLIAMPFVIDVRASWDKKPPTPADFELPEDALIMTTVSNHLYHRLSDEMCWAIREILLRCPKAYYAPIGHIPDEKALREKFPDVGNRVVFLGSRNNPSQCARAMHLFLNEFPFGSCLGMLDAMAAGCPVVSMYDPKGPPQARYGGSYFGIDRTIQSLNPQDYVDLAVKLLEDQEMYNEWSQEAVRCYDAKTDTAAYIRRFESELERLTHQEIS